MKHISLPRNSFICMADDLFFRAMRAANLGAITTSTRSHSEKAVNGYGKVSDVAAGIRRSATLQELEGSAREAVDKCCDFLINNAKYMKYDV
jgi:hypothetical protein